MRAWSWTRRMLIAAACLWIATQPAAAADKPDPATPASQSPLVGNAQGPTPLTFTVVGNQLRITGDPAAVARAYELGRMILEDKNQVYRAFHLQYVDATEVARVLEEWFNGPPKTQSQTSMMSALAALALRRRGRGGPPAPPPPPPEPPRIRVVADPENDTLLVRGTTLDLLAVERVLKSAIDVEPGESQAAMKPFVIGPLQYAVATEVLRVLKDVYQQDLDQSTVRGARRASPFRRPTQPLDPSGRPKPVSVTLAADDRTNSIIGMAPGPKAADIRKLVGVLEEKARVDTKAVELVPANGIDPNLLQSVIDSIQAKPPATVPQRRGPTPLPSRR